MQLVDSDWPANILAGSHFRAQETRALSPDGVCALARARLGTRLFTTLCSTYSSTYIWRKVVLEVPVVPMNILN